MTCKNCGAEYHPGDRFCSSCGQKTDLPPESQTQPEFSPASPAGLQPPPVLILEEHKPEHAKKRELASAVILFGLVFVLLAVALAVGYFAFFVERSPYDRIEIPDLSSDIPYPLSEKQNASYDAFVRSILKSNSPEFLEQYDRHPRNIYAEFSQSRDGKSVHVMIVAEWAEYNSGAYLVVMSQSLHEPDGKLIELQSVMLIDQTNIPVTIPVK